MVHLEIQYHLGRYGVTQRAIARELDVDELMVSQAIPGDGTSYWKKWSSKFSFFWDVFSAFLWQTSRAVTQPPIRSS